MKKITLLFFTLCTSLIFAQTTIGVSSLFSAISNNTYSHMYQPQAPSDGNSGEEVIFKINITNLPTGGANYRVYKTGTDGGNSNPTALILGLNTIIVAADEGVNRTVKIQFTSGSIEFDSVILNGVTGYPVPDPDIGTSSLFVNTSNTTWPRLIFAARDTNPDSKLAQTLKINITSLPDAGASYQIVRTLANGTFYYSDAQALNLGLKTITVVAATFNRDVKFRFSSGDIAFNEISLNNATDDKAVSSSELFDDVSNTTWPHQIVAVTAARDGANSQTVQNLLINITKMPAAGANYRVRKTIANGSYNTGGAQSLSIGLNTITVTGENFNRTVTLQFTTGEDIEYNSITLNGSVYWDGSTDTSWDTALNWSTNTVPASTSDILIREGLTNYPIISGTTGATTNNLTVDATASLLINGGSLIVNGTSAGNITYKRNLGTTNFYLVSSPIEGETYDDAYVTANSIASGTGDNRGIAPYTPSDDSWDYMQSGETATFAAGNGYSVKRSATGDISFTGTLNTADVSAGALITAGNRFNLLGNPYTSHIASFTFLTNEAAVSETQTLWVWNQATGDSGAYEVKTLAAAMVLAPAQAFFVKANAAGGTFNFAESNQASTGGTFQRTANRPEIYLSISNQTDAREAKIYFIDNMTSGFDVGYEGELFNGVSNPLAIYTHLVADSEGQNYQVQSLPTNNYENMIVPVGVNAASGSAITIEASTNNFPEGLKIFLEDKQDNSFTLLDADANFNTTLENDLNGIGRFYLHTNQSVLNINDTSLDNVSVFKVNNSLRVLGLQQGKASVKLFNILGRQVLNAAFESNGTKDISLPRLAKGVYIVQLETAEGKLNKKIILE